jgi:Uma2 family endonuclease
MAIARQRITEDEFMRFPDDGRKHELVDGEAKVSPTRFHHDYVGAHVIRLLGPSTDGRGYITSSQAGFRMKNGNVRCPDVAFTSKEHYPDGVLPDWFLDFAPDLVIEISSPSDDKADFRRKMTEYFEAGTRLLWHLDRTSTRVIVYTSPTTTTILSADDEIEGGDVLPDFRCKVSHLFAIG